MLYCNTEGSTRAVAILLSGARITAGRAADAESGTATDLPATAVNAGELLEAVARCVALVSHLPAPDAVLTDGTAMPRVRGNQVAKQALTIFAGRSRDIGGVGERIAAIHTRVVGRITYQGRIGCRDCAFVTSYVFALCFVATKLEAEPLSPTPVRGIEADTPAVAIIGFIQRVSHRARTQRRHLAC